jgi:hypothetical protein
MARTGRLPAVVAVALLAVGCQAGDDPVVGGSPAATEGSLATEAPAGGSEEADGPGGAALGACGDEDRRAVDEVVGGQLAAFAAGDFAAALDLTTPQFQSGIDVAAFEALITEGFPVPASATGHRLVACTTDGRAAVAEVDVTGTAGEQSLQYGLLRIDGTWRIDGAVPVGQDAPDGPVI